MDADPPPPIRVTQVAFSHDGMCMATVDVTATLDERTDMISLKFWQWSAGERRYILNTRVDNPHKTEVSGVC